MKKLSFRLDNSISERLKTLFPFLTAPDGFKASGFPSPLIRQMVRIASQGCLRILEGQARLSRHSGCQCVCSRHEIVSRREPVNESNRMSTLRIQWFAQQQ